MTRTYMVQISLQNSGGKVVFSGGFHGTPPWALTGVKVPWSLKCKRHVCPTSFFHVLLNRSHVYRKVDKEYYLFLEFSLQNLGESSKSLHTTSECMNSNCYRLFSFSFPLLLEIRCSPFPNVPLDILA